MARFRRGRIRASYYSKRFRKVIYKRYRNVREYMKSRRALKRFGLRLRRR